MESLHTRPLGWSLRPGVHAVAVQDDLVFLDVRTEQYLCVPDGRRWIELSPDRQRAHVADPAIAAELETAGLIAPGASPQVIGSGWSLPPPRASALRADYPLPRLGDLCPGIRSLADVATNYRGCGFSQIVQRVSRRKAAAGRRPNAQLADIVDRFHRWIPYAPVSGKCLLRSFMLLGVLQREGHTADWVFGVSTWPFRAHCWLQSGELVLDDHHERVAGFHPIMVL